MSHGFDAMCEYGTLHTRGCSECEDTPEGRSPHGSTEIVCPTPDRCQSAAFQRFLDELKRDHDQQTAGNEWQNDERGSGAHGS